MVFLHTHLTDLRDDHPLLPIYAQVAEAARSRRLHVVESFPFLVGQGEHGLWVSTMDPHPNRRGHALLADALAAGISGLPPRCFAVRPSRPGPLPVAAATGDAPG